MTSTLEQSRSTWGARPGWGIAVDLTPREVVQARQVRVHQRLVLLTLLVVLTLVAGIFLLVSSSRSSAQGSYDDAQMRTTQLSAQTREYAVVTTMQRVIEQVRTESAALLANDVDVVNLMARIRAGLPRGLQLTNLTVILTPVDEAPVTTTPPAEDEAEDGTAEPTAPAPVVPGSQIIGSVSIAGTGAALRQITPFVRSLNRSVGVVDVVPSSVGTTDEGIQFTITANITDELYTGRYGAVTPAPAPEPATDEEVAP